MICNDPAKFRDEMVAGFVLANSDYAMQVSGGVVRSTETPRGKVALVNGGGSGHYPAFCGIVGDGFMDGAAVGNVFTSPSVDDMYSVAKAVENGGGVLIIGGNFAGDRMNFDLARDRLRGEGVDARTFYLSDDVASAKPEEWQKRRGNVGMFNVYKMVGAAAAAGKSMDEVFRIVAKCNDRTRTMSVGLHGCTLPGHPEPLFHVPAGKMEMGQGIHGEAGVYEDEVKKSAEIAEVLVERVLAEKPTESGNRVAVVLDGLGSTKYEELFVMWNTIAPLLTAKGLEIVAPQVGELVTSLDMAGVALAVTFLDDELEELWLAPADTPAFRRGTCSATRGNRRALSEQTSGEKYEGATETSKELAARAVEAFRRVKARMLDKEDELAKLDAVAGDGDHGRGMVKGATCALEAIESAVASNAGLGGALQAAGKAWGQAGGTSGVLWGNALEAVGKTFDDKADEISPADWSKAISAAVARVRELGHAELGDKTLVDALVPFADAFADAVHSGATLSESCAVALAAADKAAQSTKDMVAKVGRARSQAQRAVGLPDPGAISFVHCLAAACGR